MTSCVGQLAPQVLSHTHSMDVEDASNLKHVLRIHETEMIGSR